VFRPISTGKRTRLPQDGQEYAGKIVELIRGAGCCDRAIYQGDIEVMHQNLCEDLAWIRRKWTPSAASLAALEASPYMRNQLLRDTDWSSMARGLDVRVLLVDPVLLDTVASVACTGQWSEPGVGKASLALDPSTPLPERIVLRAKTGVTTPVGRWLQSRSLNPSAALLRADGRPQHWARQWVERLAAHSETSRAYCRVVRRWSGPRRPREKTLPRLASAEPQIIVRGA